MMLLWSSNKRSLSRTNSNEVCGASFFVEEHHNDSHVHETASSSSSSSSSSPLSSSSMGFTSKGGSSSEKKMPSIYESESAFTMRSRGFKVGTGVLPPQRSQFADIRRGHSFLSIKLSDVLENGRHPTYEVRVRMQHQDEELLTWKRFRDFRALHRKIGSLSNIRRIYKNKFPPTYFKSAFGLSLSHEELAERATMLQAHMSEVLYRAFSEGWNATIICALNDFLTPNFS